MSSISAVNNSAYSEVKRPSLNQLISKMDANSDGSISKSEFDAVTSATNQSSSMGKPKLSFEQLTGGKDSISTDDLKALLEKLKIDSRGPHKHLEAKSDATTGATANTASVSQPSSTYSADATTGATSLGKVGTISDRLSLVLTMLDESNSNEASYSANNSKTLLSIINGVNVNA